MNNSDLNEIITDTNKVTVKHVYVHPKPINSARGNVGFEGVHVIKKNGKRKKKNKASSTSRSSKGDKVYRLPSLSKCL